MVQRLSLDIEGEAIDFDELMRLFYAAVTTVQEGKADEIEIEREFGDMDDTVSITVCRSVQHLVYNSVQPKDEKD